MGDDSGFMDAAELKDLCAILMIEASFQEADKLSKDGKICAKEFFAWYVGCTNRDAALVFAKHNTVFKEFAGKPLKEWSEKAVKDVLKIFKDFDKDDSGLMDAAELKDLCAILMIEASDEEADKLSKDGKIGAKEFFA